jgi:hypothetical protein
MAEWSLVKVVLHADKAKEPAIYQVAAYVGSGNDKAVCIFCGKGFAALVDRVRKHVAGDGGAGAGIAACAGPAAHASEEPAEFAARQASFVAARAACCAKVAELHDAAAARDRKRSLDQFTAPHAFVPDGAKERPLKQKTLTDSTARHLKATEDLARGFYSAGIAGNMSSTSCCSAACCRSLKRGGRGGRPAARNCLAHCWIGSTRACRPASLRRAVPPRAWAWSLWATAR